MAGAGRLELSYEDQVIAPVELGDASDSASATQRMRVGLPKSCIGRCDLTARYVLPPGLKTSGNLRVPLVMPLDAEFAGSTLSVVPVGDQPVEVLGGDWVAADDSGSGTAPPRTREFSDSRPAGEVVLKLGGGGSDGSTVVERAWLQTLLPHVAGGTNPSPDARQDHLVLQVATRGRQLEIGLPPAPRESMSRSGCSSPTASKYRASRLKNCRPRRRSTTTAC